MTDTNSILYKIGQAVKAVHVASSGGGVTPPGLTSQPVTWTNLTEINLSGEKLVNGDFSNTTIQYIADSTLTSGGSPESPVKIIVLTSVTIMDTIFPSGSILHGVGSGAGWIRMEDPNDTRPYPYTTANENMGTWVVSGSSGRGTAWEYARSSLTPHQWSVHSGTLDQSKLSEGVIKGDGGFIKIDQMFSTPIASGTKLVIKATRTDASSNNIHIYPLKIDGAQYTSQTVPTDGFREFETTQTTYGIRLHLSHTLYQVSELSVFQGAMSGGTVQATTNTLSKISGANGYNSGGSSTHAIPASQDGYFQFQYGGGGSVHVKATYLDDDFDNQPSDDMGISIQQDGQVLDSGFNSGTGFALMGTWLRIRHYSGDNQIKFQRLQDIYSQNTNFALPTAPNNGAVEIHTFSEDDRPLVIALMEVVATNNTGTNGMTEGRVYRMHKTNTASSFNSSQIYELDGTLVGWIGNRGTKWEVVESAGQDYVTFHTHGGTTTNAPLYLDTSLFHIGSQINDATVVS